MIAHKIGMWNCDTNLPVNFGDNLLVCSFSHLTILLKQIDNPFVQSMDGEIR